MSAERNSAPGTPSSCLSTSLDRVIDVFTFLPPVSYQREHAHNELLIASSLSHWGRDFIGSRTCHNRPSSGPWLRADSSPRSAAPSKRLFWPRTLVRLGPR
jgi:hypothetical protein